MIRKKVKTDLLQSASKLQCNTALAKEHTRSPVIHLGLPLRSRTGVGEDRWPTRLSLTLPK